MTYKWKILHFLSIFMTGPFYPDRGKVDHHMLCQKNIISLYIFLDIFIVLCRPFPICISWITKYPNHLMQLWKKLEKLGVVVRFTPVYPNLLWNFFMNLTYFVRELLNLNYAYHFNWLLSIITKIWFWLWKNLQVPLLAINELNLTFFELIKGYFDLINSKAWLLSWLKALTTSFNSE